jgi:hypothetical protein
MWPDNETSIDLLGFEYLVDELEVLLTEQRLLPVTVGVNGGWGSGKSSLMEMTRCRLESSDNDGHFICVPFSPWRFEDFSYGKVALMAAVVDAIADRIGQDAPRFADAIEKANSLRGKLRQWGIFRHLGTVGAAAAGAGPEEAAAAGAATDAIAAISADEAEAEYQRTFETVSHFHEEFVSLMEAFDDDVQAVVVFIDDMDRCSTETIIETFEAMRLFLHAPKTAYVVGADVDVVEAALAGRYPVRSEGDEDLGRHYLEKMLQNVITVPPLFEPEAQTYINLLFAELYVSAEHYQQLCDAANKNRASNQLSVAMNEGIAQETIGELPAELTAGLAIAAQVGPPLARGLRGNPRQLKRFLNRLLLRRRTAEKRGMDLDAAKLAKLMVLEELHPADFELLFTWQADADGAPEQLRVAERLARDEDVENPPDEVSEWLVLPGIREWLRLEPSLAGELLTPYYTFSRDRLTKMVSAARLPAELQRLLVGLQSDLEPIREKAITDCAALEKPQLAELLEPLIEAAMADLGSGAAKSLLGLAEKLPEVASAMFASLDKLPDGRVRGNFLLQLRVKFKDERLEALLARWEEKGGADVKRQAQRARRKQS